jgi:hypothetical protein
MISEDFTVGTVTPVKILDSQNFEQHIYLHNNHGNKMYLGGSDVSSTNGLHLETHATIELRIPQDNELYALADSSEGNIVVLRPR